MPELNLRQVRPYGDTFDDGRMQVSFTLPLPNGPRAEAAALMLATRMGLDGPQIVYTQDLGVDYTFFVLFGASTYSVDVSEVQVHAIDTPVLEFDEVNEFVRARVGRPIVIVGATAGSDCHTVGLDAILNMKGFKGDPGLERYTMFEVHNLGAQVENERLLAAALRVRADVLLVSQVVTQKEVHLKNLTHLVDLAEAENIRGRLLLIVGGPRISHALAKEVGFDAGFGPGTSPSAVASYVAHEMAARVSSSQELER
jgi:beta-lysine 5,6-aminomutase beta subunit